MVGFAERTFAMQVLYFVSGIGLLSACSSGWFGAADLLRPDIGIANDAAKEVILLANISGEIRATCPDWIELLDDELCFDLGNPKGPQ